MTAEQLIKEGRKLQRACAFLTPAGTGPITAQWYELDEAEMESTGRRHRLTVDASQIPGLEPSMEGYLNLFSDDDWHDLIDDQLLVFTLQDAEPWLEAWRDRAGGLAVIQRTT